jgi:hypothetical protein
MSRRTQENLVVLVFVAIFIGVIVLSLDFGPRARMIPLPLASFGLILALIQLVWQNLGSTETLRMDMIRVEKPRGVQAAAEEERAGEEKAQDAKPSLSRRAAAYGIVAALLALILAVGPLPAVFVFTLGYFLLTRYFTPWWALVYTSVFTGALYLLFFVVLQINPYHGLLAPLVARFE